MKVYELLDEGSVCNLGYYATKKEALDAQAWWHKKGDLCTVVQSIELAPTRKGVVDLLTRYGRDGG